MFDRTEHRIAAIAGWLIFAASVPYTLWALLWVVCGIAVLHIVLNTTASAEGRYGFLTWIGFWSAWPYVLFARDAWRKQTPHDDTVSLLTEASALADDLWARVSRTGQPGFPAGGASNALDDAVRMIDRLIAEHKIATETLREAGLTARFQAKCALLNATDKADGSPEQV